LTSVKRSSRACELGAVDVAELAVGSECGRHFSLEPRDSFVEIAFLTLEFLDVCLQSSHTRCLGSSVDAGWSPLDLVLRRLDDDPDSLEHVRDVIHTTLRDTKCLERPGGVKERVGWGKGMSLEVAGVGAANTRVPH
jgi:hypothetical protein